MSYQRHTLCYLKADAQPLDSTIPAANNLFKYWLNKNFPLIYTHQPDHLKSNQTQLAIPYVKLPTQEKVRVSYIFASSAIRQSTLLPSLNAIFPDLAFKSTITMRVYGSYCWQYLTQQPYVQPSSDLDIQILYSSESLTELIKLPHTLLNYLPIPTVDGEVHFPNFGDCSWLELIQLNSNSILFKSTQQIYLLPREQLYAAFPTLLA